jgi:hypothetical protein
MWQNWACRNYWHRYSDDEEEEEEEEEEEKCANAMSYGVDTNWYGDTGATDHIIGELNKLTMKEKYKGKDQIHAANGQGMSISHVGHAIVKTPSKSLHLKNVLHVPNATKKSCFHSSLY